MSERGAFVSQYFYCEKCFEAVRKALSDDSGGWRGPVVQLLNYKGEPTRQLAGTVYELAPEQEHAILELYRDTFESAICHPFRLVVLQAVGPPIEMDFEPRAATAG